MKVLCTSQMGTGTVMGQTMRVVAIAKELQCRGYDVQFLAAGKLIPVIKEFGLNVYEVNGMPEFEHYAKPQVYDTMPKEELKAKIKEFMEKIIKLEEEAIIRARPNLVISGTITGAAAAGRQKVPSILAFLQPHGEKTISMFSGRMQNLDEHEKKQAGENLLSMIRAANIIILEGMPEISGGITPERLGQTFAEMKEKIRFTGPLLINRPNELPDRRALKKLHSGEENKAMAYITIGGGSPLIGEQFLKVVLDALRIMPEVVGVIATGVAMSPTVIEGYSPPTNAIIKGFVPGTEMVKASDVTVFHGGSSTLMTCIACGTPAVVIPSMGEQEDNGAVLSQNGAGVVLDKQTLTPEILADAVQKIIGGNEYRESAQRLKQLGEQYGGAKRAADWAEELMGNGR